jgi:TetR/AcrR family transcriptional regulator
VATPTVSESVDRTQNNSAQQLLDATADLLGSRGPSDVSLSDIATRSGLNSALIKYYFGNKEGLLLALLERNAEDGMSALTHLLRLPISAEAKLQIHIKGVINSFFRSPYLNRLIHYLIQSGEPESSRRVMEVYVHPMVEAYRAIIDQGVKEGQMSPVDPALFYYTLVGACDHIFHCTYPMWGPDHTPKVTEEIKQEYVTLVTKIILGGLKARPDA